mmetsp:Transcript_72882/g.117491  ORF Transcript_72882/g.117491 Transcript_72882/m.117491 type:complete len:214 (-) Transcript_72882:659-1300(-)
MNFVAPKFSCLRVSFTLSAKLMSLNAAFSACFFLSIFSFASAAAAFVFSTKRLPGRCFLAARSATLITAFFSASAAASIFPSSLSSSSSSSSLPTSSSSEVCSSSSASLSSSSSLDSKAAFRASAILAVLPALRPASFLARCSAANCFFLSLAESTGPELSRFSSDSASLSALSSDASSSESVASSLAGFASLAFATSSGGSNLYTAGSRSAA